MVAADWARAGAAARTQAEARLMIVRRGMAVPFRAKRSDGVSESLILQMLSYADRPDDEAVMKRAGRAEDWAASGTGDGHVVV